MKLFSKEMHSAKLPSPAIKGNETVKCKGQRKTKEDSPGRRQSQGGAHSLLTKEPGDAEAAHSDVGQIHVWIVSPSGQRPVLSLCAKPETLHSRDRNLGEAAWDMGKNRERLGGGAERQSGSDTCTPPALSLTAQ